MTGLGDCMGVEQTEESGVAQVSALTGVSH